MMRNNEIPSKLTVRWIVSLHKNKDPSNPNNYRPISLMDTLLKVYTRIILNRITPYFEYVLSRVQFGFRKGHSTTEALSIVRRYIDLTLATQQDALYLVFLDWNKAFDSGLKPELLFAQSCRTEVQK